ncbi:MAG: glycosyltransferase [Magnetococcales bacterium]|nr:glycosyltransferase [Magnetococcales bacterium]MBF0115130.1 glycosyltransferase [Magnetococcales bacterium]
MPDPHLIVVIPAHDEPLLLDTLDSLCHCHPAPAVVEVVVVINGSEQDTLAVQQRNHLSWQQSQQWIAQRPVLPFAITLLYEPTLPARHAGVGTARKMGMDWAAQRFAPGQRQCGVIVCLDADCQVAPDYLVALCQLFASAPEAPGCSLYFEHPLQGLPNAQRQAILHYELYLRYYLHGLRWSGFPHAFHTIGSSMAVRANAYRAQGGMNRRKAGEDFYFLQKIIPIGGFRDLCHTTVYPSPRPSHRVPFGTGRAIAEALAAQKDLGLVYDPRLFALLADLFRGMETLYQRAPTEFLPRLHPCLQAFLVQHDWPQRFQEMRQNTTSLAAFQKRFYLNFNAFTILKFIHFASAEAFPKQAIGPAARQLLLWMQISDQAAEEEGLLAIYRHLDRSGFWYDRSG